MRKGILYSSIVFFLGTWLHAEVRLHPLFSDGAVLQRETILPVWGTARDREKVTVSFAGQSVSTIAAGGVWKVELAAMKAGGPHTMTIRGENVVTLRDLWLGDVWLCSGQSNMHFRMQTVENAEREISAMHAPAVRFFTVKQQFARTAQSISPGEWKKLTPEQAAECSAVAGYFGNALHQKTGVPVGLLISSVGGTRIESWMRPETLAATGESALLVRRWQEISDQEFERIGETYARFQHERDVLHPQAVKLAKQQGQKAPAAPVTPKLRCHDCPSALHHGMIAPLEPFALRGFVWYQGESNAGNPSAYEKLLPAMIADWRGVWGKDLPFLFVQLAPHQSIHPAFREAQSRIWQRTPRTAMVVTTDAGNHENIHPARKKPVGERLALAARALVYGEDIESSGPVFDRMNIDGSTVTLTFQHTGSGLMAKDGELKGFTIAGENGKFQPATARIEGRTVVCRSEGIPHPKTVKYNWSKAPDGNLFNREGLPAVPFTAE